jgi:transposase
MKIIRSSKCNLKYLTSEKREQLENIRLEYTKVVNLFIDLFWENTPKKFGLLKDVLNPVSELTWFSQRMIQNAARESIDMISSAKAQAEEAEEEPIKPVHFGNRMVLSNSVCDFQSPKNSKEFDNWLHLQSIGNKLRIDIPIRRHKHFNQLMNEGRLCTTVQILRNHVQFSFEIETGPKLPFDSCIGIDTGIKSLATLSTGEHLGTELESKIQRIKRCKRGSKGQKRARVDLKSYISLTAKEVVKHGSLIVFENLKGISKNTKKSKRLSKSMRSVIGNWNQAYWMQRLKSASERNRVSFRTVSPFNTSITCPICNQIDKRNRKSQGIFLCQSCGYTDNADVNAARNILNRFLTGPYGAGCQAKMI